MIRIGVIGQSGEIPPNVNMIAEEVGHLIAQHKGILISGGTSGVMKAASKGAKKAGGLVDGILPGDSPDHGNEYLDVPINTGMGFEFRSMVLVHSSDVIIMIKGGNGTLGELSAAYSNGKPIIIIENSGGWSSKIKKAAYHDYYLDERKTVKIDYVNSAKDAVELAFRKGASKRKISLMPPEA